MTLTVSQRQVRSLSTSSPKCAAPISRTGSRWRRARRPGTATQKNESLGAMPARKTTLILLVLLAALVVWIPQERKLAQARLVLAEAEARRVKLDERIATA